MLHFCTLFDSFYLSRGIALYQSLNRHSEDFTLYIFAFDKIAYDILLKKDFDNVVVISLDDFENEALLSVKNSRNTAEYCWTCTPFTIKYVLEKYNVDSCTYVDADLFFYNDPAILIEEMGKNDVLITEHRYTKKYDRSKQSGIYCVQFMTFKNTMNGLHVLRWWANACLEWCYDRYEDGKFGDQKYLDDWTSRFQGIHVLVHKGGGMAPWNIQQYKLISDDEKIKVHHSSSNQILNIVFYHFQYVRIYQKNFIDIGWYPISKAFRTILYDRYITTLLKIESELMQYYPNYSIKYRKFSYKFDGIISFFMKNLIKKIFKYNIRTIK